ncbi:MAG: InlB B-repeat-containing protein [Lachnospiraceae bacterium]|nr:InlB B-repeat-containing protein [Candidatus Cloacimonadota bacterium]MDD3140599.1 InlB B-repeat-containing protein [Lachnospiraceae bacterium]
MDKKIIIIVAIVAIVAIGVGTIVAIALNDSDNPITGRYSVTYDTNGGSGSITDSNDYKFGNVVTVKFTPTPTKTGYAFEGWSTSSTASYTSYDTPGDEFEIYGDTKLYAVWEPTVSGSFNISYTISDGFTYNMTSSYTYSEKPSSGYQYALIKFTITNNTYSSGYSPSYSDFDISCSNGLIYSYSYATSVYNNYVINATSIYDVKIATGGTYSYYVIYEIPNNSTINKISLEKWTYGYEFIFE